MISKVSPPHQLPHQCQSECVDAIEQVLPADANKRELCKQAQLHSIVAILQLGAHNTIVSCETKHQQTSHQHSSLCDARSILVNAADLLHVGSDLGVWWLVDLTPVNRHFNLFVEAEYDHAVLQISVSRGVARYHSFEVRY